jgi:hypothetical protein
MDAHNADLSFEQYEVMHDWIDTLSRFGMIGVC